MATLYLRCTLRMAVATQLLLLGIAFDEDEDEDQRLAAMMMYALGELPPPRKRRSTSIPRLQPRVDLWDMNEETWTAHFRLPRSVVRELPGIYSMPPVVTHSSRCRFRSMSAVLMLLYRLGAPTVQARQAYAFGYSRPYVSVMTMWALEWIFDKSRQRVQTLSRSFLTEARLTAYSDCLHQFGVPYFRIFGFVDGTTHLPVRVCAKRHCCAVANPTVVCRHRVSRLKTWWRHRRSGGHLQRLLLSARLQVLQHRFS